MVAGTQALAQLSQKVGADDAATDTGEGKVTEERADPELPDEAEVFDEAEDAVPSKEIPPKEAGPPEDEGDTGLNKELDSPSPKENNERGGIILSD
mgnify:CR=1 FL=1